MAKTRMVTRTILSTSATVLCLNTETAEPFNETVLLAGTFKDSKSLLKAAKDAVETDEVSVCKVVNVEVETKLYGMTEADFLSHAKELPPRTSNPAPAENA